MIKKEGVKTALRTTGKQAMKVAKKAWRVDNKDLFIMLVVGQRNFEQDNSHEMYMKCGSAIKLPEHYSVCQEKGTQKKPCVCRFARMVD